ncbi:hypothetical protein AAG029_004418 [Salmonella enterica]
MKTRIAFLSLIIVVVIVAMGLVFYKLNKENEKYVNIKSQYLLNPDAKNKTDFLNLVSKQKDLSVFSLSLFQQPFEKDNKKELILKALDAGDYKFASYLLSYIYAWIPNEVDINFLGNRKEQTINFINFYKQIGEKIFNVDSSNLTDKLYNIKVIYAVNTMNIGDFYSKYAFDILKTGRLSNGVYIQAIFSYLGCLQEEMAWKTLTKADTPAVMNEAYGLKDIKDTNEAEFFKQKKALKNRVLPDMSQRCKVRFDNEENTKLKFINGFNYSNYTDLFY